MGNRGWVFSSKRSLELSKKNFRENHHQGFGGDYMLTEFYSNSNARVITASE